MKRNKNRLNTYYLKRWRKKASDIWCVVTVMGGFSLRKYCEVTYGAYEYSSSGHAYIEKDFFNDRKKAYKRCDELRRELILSWLKEARFRKENKLGEIY